MKKLLLALVLAASSLWAQTNPVTAAYPSAIVTDDQMNYADDHGATTLAVAVGASDATITITSAVGFLEPSIVALCPLGECSNGNYSNVELVSICGISGVVLTVCTNGRAMDQTCTGSATGSTFVIGDIIELTPTSCSMNRVRAEVMAIETALGANLVNVVEPTDIDTEAELEASLTDVSNLIVSTEIDTEAKFEALVAALNFIVSTEIDTEAELEALVAAVNIIVSTEIDTSAKIAALVTDESGTGSLLFQVNPNVQGTIDFVGTAVDRDTCVGFQGTAWWDSTDSRLELCNANTGTPLVMGAGSGGGGGGATTEAELESDLTDVTDVFTNNDGALADDNLTNNTIGDLSGITITSWATGDVLGYNGSALVDYILNFSELAGAASDGQIPDTITVSNYLPLVGGTLTGSLVTDNLGIEFTESDTNPTCAAGFYGLWADLSELEIKKCVNGVTSDLDTGGAEVNDLTAAVTWANVPNANITGGAVTQHEAALAILSSQVSGSFGDAQVDNGITLTNLTQVSTRLYSSLQSIPSLYGTVQDEASGLTQRATLNFTGAGVSCVDNPGATRTDCSIGGGGSTHDILSATHTDTTAAAVVRGDLMTGQTATPEWTRLGLGGSATFLRSNATDALWAAIVDGDVPNDITIDSADGVALNAVALGADTTGNYVADVNPGVGIAVTGADAEDTTKVVAFDFSDAGADPPLGAEECRFSNEGASAGGWVCEGLTPNTIETRFRVTDPTSADRVITFPDATGEVSLLGQTIEAGEANADFLLASEQDAGTDITGNLEEEGQISGTTVTGNAIANQLLVGTGANALAYSLVPSCSNATTEKLNYNNSTQAWTCNTDQTGGAGGTTYKGAIVLSLDGGGSAISTGIAKTLVIEEAITITRADVWTEGGTCNLVVDIWVDTTSALDAGTLVDADSITASAPPTLTADRYATDSTLTGWTLAVAAGSAVRYNVDSATCTTGQVALFYDKTASATWEGLSNGNNTKTDYTSDNTAETVEFDFESAFGASQQFLIRQQTGNPTAGTLLDVRAADTNVTVFRAGDGTNGITVSQAGTLTAEGTGSITATTAAALTSDPTDCSANLFAITIAANGDLTCASTGWDDEGAFIRLATSTDAVTIGGSGENGKLTVVGDDAAQTTLVVKGADSQTGVLQSWQNNASSALAWIAIDGDVISIENYLFRSGTAFDGILDHSNTVSRTWTFPDVTANVVLDTATQTLTGKSIAAGSNTITGIDAAELDDNMHTRKCSFILETPTTADDGKLQCEVPSAATLLEVACNVAAATSVTVNLYERARATPETGTTGMLTSNLVCTTTGAASSTFTDAALAGDVPLALGITAVSGTPEWVRVHVKYRVD